MAEPNGPSVVRYSGVPASESVVDRVHEYQRHAAECLLLAEQVADPASRTRLLAMAQSWARLLDLAEKNKRADPSVAVPLQHLA